ncbi:hypothetical protein [Solemya velesiana gill symbiont]|uniref:hypothetical protein n=1 Tax=Solemya velesiana gill symbiont TaxID=1918948 RepID=UPI003CCBC253
MAQDNIRFHVRWVSSLQRKAEAKTEGAARQENPLLPPEPELTVGEITPTHLGVLNKLNVIDNHLLIVTRTFEPQDSLLNETDFEALCCCLTEFPSLGFYNGGEVAGASQRHKHLQLVPLPLSEGAAELPTQPLLDSVTTREQVTRIPELPFSNGFVRFDEPVTAGDAPPGSTAGFRNCSKHLACRGFQAGNDCCSRSPTTCY